MTAALADAARQAKAPSKESAGGTQVPHAAGCQLMSDARETPAAGRRCPACGAAPVSSDGYCQNCGHRAAPGNDHVELALDLLAGVTDRGLRHPRNEDAMALATTRSAAGPVALAVVCDGVSSSSDPDLASQAASQSAIAVLLAAVRRGDDLAQASAQAVQAAQHALSELAGSARRASPAPSATFVSAVVSSSGVTICWLGDSRAYWIDAAGAERSARLTVDDSIAQELIAAGVLSEAEALASPHGHVVTSWIGAEGALARPHVRRFSPAGPGAVLLCSDGLWNYQPDAAGLARRSLPAAISEPRRTAAALVQFALESGGSDNVTVVLIPFPPAGTRSQGDTSQFAATDIGDMPAPPPAGDP